ncbi:hypothetical protein HK097_009770 [Rhizophlyctis rosea]|uniref:Potassium channel tetramerisation-type BTB domain-containing protein n=1 Tax=Rhizophlyctis rosea TaxID=64517 RepID=A0AAD5X0V5_9FUNG|nr:hypothetical protein HK097_009770 [Rhizophlyctis rosea]
MSKMTKKTPTTATPGEASTSVSASIANLSANIDTLAKSASALKTATVDANVAFSNLETETSKMYDTLLRTITQARDLHSKRLHTAKTTHTATMNQTDGAGGNLVAAGKTTLEEVEGLTKGLEIGQKELDLKREQWDIKTDYSAEMQKKQASKVKLDIGGHIYHVSTDTLLRQEGTFFYGCFSGRWLVEPDKDGAFFIDRDGELYTYIFNFLRDGETGVLPIDPQQRQRLIKEAEYLSMEQLVETLKKPVTPVLTQPPSGLTQLVCPQCKWNMRQSGYNSYIASVAVANWVAPHKAYVCTACHFKFSIPAA